ncbi:hypothetical protein RI054_02g08990 [Pseudoscourfieldia marina]
MHVDPMFLCHTTGHDGKGFSNLFEYMDASVAMAIPGAVVLAGGLRYRARSSEKRRCPPTSSASSRKAIVSGWSCTLRPCQAIETVEGMKLYDPGASADTTLIRWSAELRAKFTSDNQHLLLPAVSNNAEMAVRVVRHVVELTQQVVRMREEISELRARHAETPSQAQPRHSTNPVATAPQRTNPVASAAAAFLA